MQQNLVLPLGEVVKQAWTVEAVGLKDVPSLVAKISLVKADVKETYDCARLFLLVCNLFFNPDNLEVIKSMP